MRTRKLSLNKETLAELSIDELEDVVGAAIGVTKNSCICSDFASCLPSRNCPVSLGSC